MLALNPNLYSTTMKKLLLLCLPFAATLAMALKGDDAAAKYAALITQQGLKEKLTILAGDEMEGQVTHNSNILTTITFSTSVAGKAYLN